MQPASISKTNAMRVLDQLGITYQVRAYEIDLDDLSAETVAAKVGLPPEQVFKTLVVVGERTGVSLAAIPAGTQLDLKALAEQIGDRKVETAALKDLQILTGYVRGGVTALACRKPYPVFADESIVLFDMVAVSAGVRGLQIVLPPRDYLRAVNGTIVSITK